MLEGQAKQERGCAILNSLLRESLATETFESKLKVKKKTKQLKVRSRKPTSCLSRGTQEEGVPADGTMSVKAKGGSRPGGF